MDNYINHLSRFLAPVCMLFAGLSATALADDVYVAKILCFDNNLDGNYVVTGNYRTVVNIYNPQPFPMNIQKKASRAALERENWDEAVDLSEIATHTLRPMQTMAVDCRDIRFLYVPPPGGAFYDGFLEVRVPTPTGEPGPALIVKRVTTAERRSPAGGPDNDIETIDIERIHPVSVPPAGGAAQ